LARRSPIPVDVRVISATHRDLDAQKARGHFREDLYYRLNVVSLRLPALAERREDIPLLATHFLRRLAERYKAAGADARSRRDGAADCGALARERPPAPELARAGGGARHDKPHSRVARPGLAAARTRACSCRSKRRGRRSSATISCGLLKITNGNVTQAALLAKRNRTEFYKLLQRHRLEPAMFKEGKAS
jgi:two-component system response regulator GlrR